MILQGERQTLAIVLRVQSGQRLGVQTQPEMTSFLRQDVVEKAVRRGVN